MVATVKDSLVISSLLVPEPSMTVVDSDENDTGSGLLVDPEMAGNDSTIVISLLTSPTMSETVDDITETKRGETVSELETLSVDFGETGAVPVTDSILVSSVSTWSVLPGEIAVCVPMLWGKDVPVTGEI